MCGQDKGLGTEEEVSGEMDNVELGGTEQGETSVPPPRLPVTECVSAREQFSSGSTVRAQSTYPEDQRQRDTHKLVTLGPPESTKDRLNGTSVTGHLGTRRGRQAAMSGSEATAQHVTSP